MKNTGNDAAASPGDRGSDPQAERSERAAAAGISGGVTAHDSGGGQGPCAIRAERPVAGGDTPSMRRAPEAAAANIRRSSSPARVAATATDNKADTTAPDSSPRRAAADPDIHPGSVPHPAIAPSPGPCTPAADDPADPDGTEARIAVLMRCVTPERLAAFERAAAMRTRYLTVVAENTYHGQNAAALVRHCEAFGIQQMHTVETLCPFRPSADAVRGTDKWGEIVRHGSTAAMRASLRAAGFRIVATTPHRRSCTPESLDVGAGPIALVFGTEREGISPEVAAAADEFLCIPMCGMVESLNVSASAAIVLYRLSERMRAGAGGWRLAGREQRELVLRWLRGTVRSADDILRRAGFDTDR